MRRSISQGKPIYDQDIRCFKVPLTQGEFALIDECDVELVSQFLWQNCIGVRNGSKYNYARKDGRSGKPRLLHCFVMGVLNGVDHKNGNGLDCRRGNLRIFTGNQNQVNRRKLRPTASKFKGVTQFKGVWRASIRDKRKLTHLGTFGKTPKDEIAAARRYDEEAIRLWGEFAKTNVMLGLLPPLSETEAA